MTRPTKQISSKNRPKPSTLTNQAKPESPDIIEEPSQLISPERAFPTSDQAGKFERLATVQRREIMKDASQLYGNRWVQRMILTLKHPTVMRDFVPGADKNGNVVEPKAKHPENFPTYEQWLKELGDFANKHHFTSHDTPPKPPEPDGDLLMPDFGFKVLGDEDSRASHDPKASADEKAVEPVNPGLADHFIDHPTSKWLKANLPEELIYCAYQLPADCADIAVILRHVWLFYHNRTERYNGVVVGVGAGKTTKERHQKVHQDIVDVFTGNVANLVNAYSDGSNPIRELKKLKNLLHAGDILVWQHRKMVGKKAVRSGGHTHTITSVERDPGSGEIKDIKALQGNEPIFEEQAAEIRKFLKQKPYAKGTRDPLRDAPGRRIEIGDLDSSKLKETDEGIWCWSDTPPTVLVAAGPPAGATKPLARGSSKRVLGTPADWLPILKNATGETLQGAIETALQAVRSMVEADQTVEQEVAAKIGEAAGGRLYKLDHKSTTFDKDAHLVKFKEIEAVMDAIAAATTLPKFKSKVSNLFSTIKENFERAALRNETTVGNTRRIPVEGLSGGFQPKGKSGVGQAVVIIPPAAKISNAKTQPPVEVLLHLHGYEARLDKGEASHDVAMDKMEQQLEASGRPMIGVLPQGSSKSSFGDDFNSNTYIDEVFKNLAASGVWATPPAISQVVLSAHSGGGFTLAEGGMLGDSSRTPSDKQLGEVALFDAINGPNEFKALEGWLFPKMEAEVKKLNSPDKDTAEKKETYLKQKAFRFKAYHTGEENVKPNVSANGSYATRHAQLRLDLNKWFNDHAADLGGAGSKVFEAFRQNYEVKATGGGEHESLMGRGHVKDALAKP